MAARILVLEDNVHLAPPLVRLLARMGYEVTHVDCCAKARAVESYFDLGVFDLELPDGDGIDVGAELVRAGTLRSLVFYTGTLKGALLSRARKVAPCILKTDGIGALLEAIRGTLTSVSRRASGSGNGGQIHH